MVQFYHKLTKNLPSIWLGTFWSNWGYILKELVSWFRPIYTHFSRSLLSHATFLILSTLSSWHTCPHILSRTQVLLTKISQTCQSIRDIEKKRKQLAFRRTSNTSMSTTSCSNLRGHSNLHPDTGDEGVRATLRPTVFQAWALFCTLRIGHSWATKHE